MRALASYILRGRLHGMLVVIVAAALSMAVPLVSHISGAAMSLVVLRSGVVEGLVIAATATLILSAIGLVSSLEGYLVGAFLVAMVGMVWLPGIIVSGLHRSARSFGTSLAAAGLLGLAAIVLLHLAVDDVEAWWASVLRTAMIPMMDDLLATAPETDLDGLIKNMAAMMTGVMAATMVYSIMINLFIARWWQSLLYNPGGFRDEFQSLRMGRKATAAALAVIALSTFAGDMLGSFSGSLVVLTVAVFSLQGLSVAHAIHGRFNAGTGWLIGMYVLIMLMPPQMLVVLSAAGLTDSWLDFRGRLDGRGGRPGGGPSNRQGDSPESDGTSENKSGQRDDSRDEGNDNRSD